MSDEHFPVPIEAGHVLLFLRAIGADVPELGQLSPGAPVPALTFLQIADHFDPEFTRRPHHGEPWFGSSATASGAAAASDEQQGLCHTDQLFRYQRHPRIGETLSATRLPAQSWVKQGRRGGELRFIERPTEFRDAEGGLVATTVWRDVRTERRHAELSASQLQEPPASQPVPPPGASRSVLAERITRTQLVMYAGASGDFHPLHHDEPYARHAGYPGVFVPGMLAMALLARAVSARVDVAAVHEFGARFHAQLWPGDSLYAYSHDVVEVPPATRGIEVLALNQTGALIMSARATARI